jgi:hypothetical protein
MKEPMHRKTRFVATLVLMTTLALLLFGCVNPFSPRVAPGSGIPEPKPSPNSPEGVIRLFVWCWNHRNYDEYKELFTDDFRFQFALGDTAGNQFRDQPVDREEELNIAKNIFVGGGTSGEPPATRIVMEIDPVLNAQQDSRDGKGNITYRREISTNINLEITTDQQTYRVTGQARFFVVRGDSAVVPPELVPTLGHDSNRWFIERYDDETYSGAPAAVLALARTSMRQAVASALAAGSAPARALVPGPGTVYPADVTPTINVSLTYIHAYFDY